jgi:serine/threonine protein kinase
VAIKQIKQKFKTWKACIDLREVQSLRMTIHPNIVRMLEVIRESDENLYFVFEVSVSFYCLRLGQVENFLDESDQIPFVGNQYLPDGTLYDLIKNSVDAKSKPSDDASASIVVLNHETIVSIMTQVLSGLSYMNSRGFFHRGKFVLILIALFLS